MWLMCHKGLPGVSTTSSSHLSPRLANLQHQDPDLLYCLNFPIITCFRSK